MSGHQRAVLSSVTQLDYMSSDIRTSSRHGELHSSHVRYLKSFIVASASQFRSQIPMHKKILCRVLCVCRPVSPSEGMMGCSKAGPENSNLYH